MLLENIESPQDLKKLSLEQLPQLAEEIRRRIIEVVSKTGGHLASSLGAVELIVALHYCLDAPKDCIIFDVGHQAYCHKILTGRNKQFDTLRQFRGISGFPLQEESEYDTFSTGHSSTAVSLALGLACARDALEPQKHFKVVAVIGDGSLSGGLTFEGLNNVGHLKKDILVILNTNEMSIAPNVGALSNYLNKLISLPIYNRFKESLENFATSRIPKGSRLVKIANKFEEGLKGLFVPGIFFEELGFRYFGPLDGHDLQVLVPALKNILAIKGARLLHVVTKKGKGFPNAESEPVRFHGVGPFRVENGKLSQAKVGQKTYTEVFSQTLLSLARTNEKLVAITAAMPEGTGLDKFRDAFPDRFYDVGIAEPHAVCFAAGLAKGGFLPIVAIYSTFLQRAYDQIIIDACLQKAPIIFAIDRAGIVGEDGVTHQGVFDIAYLRSAPNIVIMAPKDAGELEQMLRFAISLKGAVAIRYPKSMVPASTLPTSPLELGKPELLVQGKDFALLALGSMVGPALEAVTLLKKEGISGMLLNSRFVKPLDVPSYKTLLSQIKFIFTAEEGIVEGGFGSAVSEALHQSVVKLGLPCEFIPHGKREALLEQYGLTPEGITNKIKSIVWQK